MSDAVRLLTRAELHSRPLPRLKAEDKNDHGQLLVIGGDRSLAGATILTATAAFRAGCGKVTIATVEGVAPLVAVAMPECRVIGMPMSGAGGFAPSAIDPLIELAQEQDAVVAGSGMLENKGCEALAGKLIGAGIARLALDAALLHALPANGGKARGMPVLLPHAGEMASLIGCDPQEVEDDPLGCGRLCAARYHALTLVKGGVSHVVTPDGEAWRFTGGVPGLGVSGSGDVLAGLVGGLAARGCDPLTALMWGVLLHGEAGQALAGKVGQAGFLARELPAEIPSLLSR
ncbi:NAD(P)H-hydrate dehydratase [Sphingomonas xanthus]|uniref:ADP-dependent (S)-NAD(P)H-hydrate dehydratase n=1 Tax=Sphingomonas xanthus TaxID=2594473 RepID=A0A516IQV7_9SPHN|nr:NAD(P)H-hydrate dehydratase [Sphingomonas xanthus]QDP19306.1 NAD(P)H-hydrate dehydratase [Sphingomonas xanthus]